MKIALESPKTVYNEKHQFPSTHGYCSRSKFTNKEYLEALEKYEKDKEENEKRIRRKT